MVGIGDFETNTEHFVHKRKGKLRSLLAGVGVGVASGELRSWWSWDGWCISGRGLACQWERGTHQIVERETGVTCLFMKAKNERV